MKNILLVAALLCSFTIYSQYKDLNDVSVDEMLVETQFTSDDPDALEMIWWVPIEFWEVSYSQDPTYSEEEMQILKDMLKGYELFAIVKGKIGYFGGVDYADLESILSELTVTYDGEKLVPVSESEISKDLLNFFAIMQPMMANMFGPMGQNMHFIVVQDNARSSVLPVDPKQAKQLSVELGDFKRDIELPLGSLLKRLVCPVDGKLHSGKWTYCPFHGDKLTPQQ